MSRWPTVPLATVLDRIDAGSSPKAGNRPAAPGEFGVLKLSAVSWGNFRPGENKALFVGTPVNGTPRVCAGDLLVSRANTAELVGAVVLVERDYPNLLLSDKTLRLVPNSRYVDRRFLLYALRAPAARLHIESNATGTSFSMRNISQQKLGATPIPLPPIEEQRRIAAILGCADALRVKRRAALAKADKLARVLFEEMLGDPVSNPKKWGKRKLKDCTSLIQIGPFGSLLHEADYVRDGVPLVNPRHIQDGRIISDRSETISERKYEELQLYVLRVGDVIMGRRGEMGRCAIVSSREDGFICGTGSLFIRGATSVTPMYLKGALSHPSMRRHLEHASLGVTLPNLNRAIVENLELPVPPIEAQTAFERSLALIGAIQGVAEVFQSRLDALFASLQQRAFRGEL